MIFFPRDNLLRHQNNQQGYSATLYEKDLDSVYSQTLVWLDEENHYIIQITSTGEAKNALTSDQLVMLAEGLRW